MSWPRKPREQFYRDQTDAAQEDAGALAVASMAAGGKGLVIAGPPGSGPYEGLVIERLK